MREERRRLRRVERRRPPRRDITHDVSLGSHAVADVELAGSGLLAVADVELAGSLDR